MSDATSFAGYQVELDLFRGPVDLLLYLVRKHEIQPLELQLGQLTRSFMDFITTLQYIDVDLAGDFIVAASTLTELKSRLVLPQEEISDPEEEVVQQDGDQLVQHLLQYRRIKRAAAALEDRSSEWQQRFVRLSDDRPRRGKDHRSDPIKEVELWDLVSAFSRVVQQKVSAGQHLIQHDTTPITVYAERIRKQIAERGRAVFSDLFEGERVRSRIVGVFLAILELIRHHGFRAEQPEPYGEIWVLPPADAAPQKPLPPSEFDAPPSDSNEAA